MGVSIGDIIPKKEIRLEELKGTTIAIDAFNTLYQFLTTIRQQDGTPLQDSQGNITSHLSGLFYRNIALLSEGITPVYVFDGEIPELKQEELKRRKEQKMRAQEQHEQAISKGDEQGMKTYAGRFVSITKEIIEESKKLLEAMGITWIQAPGEGEAEAAHLAQKKITQAAASQDYDTLLYKTPRLIRNLTLARKKRIASGIYIDVQLEEIRYQDVLAKLNITQEQLISLAILVGTDYNPGGVKGLGQKKALEIVQQKEHPIEIFNYIEQHQKYELNFNWKEVYEQFNTYKGETTSLPEYEFDKEKIIELLTKRGFSQQRIEKGIEKIIQAKEEQQQKGLEEYF